ncbi:MAG: thiamine phosphate synthase [Gammaproteobacteria bacterium]|nr:thiamine phosphate synthase [Gammaproteobacteria bacterium]
MAITSIILPECYLITPEPTDPYNLYLQTLAGCLKKGVRLVQFRAKTVMPDEYAVLAEKVALLCDQYDAVLLFNSTYLPELAGMHLTSTQLMSLSTRPEMHGQRLAASCHNSEQIEKANQMGIDFIVLSPIKDTNSHPNGEVLGWLEAERLCRIANMPVYALGGMSLNDLDDAHHYGMRGIAAISSLWNATTIRLKN